MLAQKRSFIVNISFQAGKSGYPGPTLPGTSPPEAVPRAVIRAIQNDLPEIIVNPLPVRPLLALIALFPSWGEWIAGKMGSNHFFRQVAEAQKNHPT